MGHSVNKVRSTIYQDACIWPIPYTKAFEYLKFHYVKFDPFSVLWFHFTPKDHDFAILNLLSEVAFFKVLAFQGKYFNTFIRYIYSYVKKERNGTLCGPLVLTTIMIFTKLNLNYLRHFPESRVPDRLLPIPT